MRSMLRPGFLSWLVSDVCVGYAANITSPPLKKVQPLLLQDAAGCRAKIILKGVQGWPVFVIVSTAS